MHRRLEYATAEGPHLADLWVGNVHHKEGTRNQENGNKRPDHSSNRIGLTFLSSRGLSAENATS